MPKLLKLKNKPFWIAAAIILIIGIAFYKQRRTEGFDTMYNVVGDLYYGKLKDLDDNHFTDATGFTKVIDASDETQVWKKGDARPDKSDVKYYILLSPPSSLNSSDVSKREKDLKSSSNGDKEYRNGYVCAVILNSGNSYRDVNDNKIIGAWTHFLGMDLLTSTFYWILGGIGGLILLIIIFMMMRSSGGGGNSYNRGNNNS
jgi:hypothetical protein